MNEPINNKDTIPIVNSSINNEDNILVSQKAIKNILSKKHTTYKLLRLLEIIVLLGFIMWIIWLFNNHISGSSIVEYCKNSYMCINTIKEADLATVQCLRDRKCTRIIKELPDEE